MLVWRSKGLLANPHSLCRLGFCHYICCFTTYSLHDISFVEDVIHTDNDVHVDNVVNANSVIVRVQNIVLVHPTPKLALFELNSSSYH